MFEYFVEKNEDIFLHRPEEPDPAPLPLILAGPIVRRVEASTVTVWMALKFPRSVTLTVSTVGVDDTETEVLSGTRESVAVGKYLHIVAVTAEDSTGPLNPDTLYSYDLSFSAVDGGGAGSESDGNTQTLGDEGVLNTSGDLSVLTYNRKTNPSRPGPITRPTFTLPPQSPDDLRLAHASCRKLHGHGQDAMVAVDEMVKWDVDNPTKRLHQLLLTGDQIYADEVSDGLLAVLQQAGTTILGWESEETFTIGSTTLDPEQIRPGRRQDVIEDGCGFSSGSASSHLLTFAEYCAMYIFCWSDTMWPELADFPSYDDIYETEVTEPTVTEVEVSIPQNESVTVTLNETEGLDKEGYSRVMSRVSEFRADLPAVRRALANVPTYMIFDDHEVTDDWYFTEEWTEGVITSPFGLQVIQNALMAYTLFQAWGNTPATFSPSGTTLTPEKTLLDRLSASAASGLTTDNRSNLNKLLDIPSKTNSGLTWPRKTNSDAVITWHYSITWHSHELIVLDTRTQRGLNGRSPPHLLDSSAMDDQIPARTENTPELTVIISPVPVWSVPALKIAQDLYASYEGNEAAEVEHWHHQSRTREQLISTLAARGVQQDATTRSSYVLLSGDVHHGYSARMHFWEGTNPDSKTEMIIAELVASGAKNQDGKTDLLHREGHSTNIMDFGVPIGLVGLGLIGFGLYTYIKNDEYWKQILGGFAIMLGAAALGISSSIITAFAKLEFGDPPTEIYDNKAPQREYRVDFIDTETPLISQPASTVTAVQNPTPESVAIPPYGEKTPGSVDESKQIGRADALAIYRDLTHAPTYDRYRPQLGTSDTKSDGRHSAWGREIVGWNNAGEIIFQGEDVIHALWWRIPASVSETRLKPFPLSEYRIPMTFGSNEPFRRPSEPGGDS